MPTDGSQCDDSRGRDGEQWLPSLEPEGREGGGEGGRGGERERGEGERYVYLLEREGGREEDHNT